MDEPVRDYGDFGGGTSAWQPSFYSHPQKELLQHSDVVSLATFLIC